MGEWNWDCDSLWVSGIGTISQWTIPCVVARVNYIHLVQSTAFVNGISSLLV